MARSLQALNFRHDVLNALYEREILDAVAADLFVEKPFNLS